MKIGRTDLFDESIYKRVEGRKDGSLAGKNDHEIKFT
jgi:hypothetical protein